MTFLGINSFISRNCITEINQNSGMADKGILLSMQILHYVEHKGACANLTLWFAKTYMYKSD